MKKIFSFFCLMLLPVQFAIAQKNIYVLSTEGKLSAYPANKITFDNDLFTFTYGEVTEITKESFSASFSVAFKTDDYKSFSQSPEVGICFSDINEEPTIYDGKIEKGSSLQQYSFKIYSLDAGTTYFYRAYIKVNNVVYYGEVCSETTYGKKSTDKIINGHKFIDLGLPSGLLWATCNIGAVTAADYGKYYAWGETKHQRINYYNWSSYKYGTSSSSFTKYNTSDNKTTLDNEDDAAYINWGFSCRMPTIDEFRELCNSKNCTWSWTSMTSSDGSSISGYQVTSVKNGNSIFFPASGWLEDKQLWGDGSYGYYWSNTLDSEGGYSLFFKRGSRSYSFSYDRCIGFTIRPVAEP